MIYEYCYCVLGKMPCWYFSRSELKNTPSFCNGVDASMEEKYRREGAKLIVDAGSVLRLYPIPLFMLSIESKSFQEGRHIIKCLKNLAA